MDNNLYLTYGSDHAQGSNLVVGELIDLNRISGDFGTGPSNLLFISVKDGSGNLITLDSHIATTGYFDSLASVFVEDGVLNYKLSNSRFNVENKKQDSILINRNPTFDDFGYKWQELEKISPVPLGFVLSRLH